MLHPTIEELTNENYNRYEIALATAKCARMITQEYVQQREVAERAATGNKDVDKNLINKINKEYRDEKAVKNAISKIYGGSYKIVRTDGTEETLAAEESEETVEAAEMLDAADADIAEEKEDATEEKAEEVKEEAKEENSAE